MGKSNFSTINNRLTVSTEGFDRGLDKAKEKLKGFGEKSSGWLEDAKDLFSSGDGLGAVGKLAGMATGFAGPIGLAATAIGSVATGLKSAYDWYKEYRKESDDAAAAKKADESAAKMQRMKKVTEEQLQATMSLAKFNVTLQQQIQLMGKSSDEAALFATKMALVKAGVASQKFFDDPVRGKKRINGWTWDLDQMRREDPLFQQFKDAQAAIKYKSDLQLAQSIKSGSSNTFAGFQQQLSDAQRLNKSGMISGGDLGRRALGVLDEVERLAPVPGSQLTSSIEANSQAAASFVLRAQASGAGATKEPAQRLAEAMERLRVTEEKRGDEASKLADAIQAGGRINVIAQF